MQVNIGAAAFLLMMAAGASPLRAAPDATPSDQSLVLSKIDTDHDGTVTLQEAQAAASAKFDALDTDHEGTLDASELIGVLDRKQLAGGDADSDKTLDRQEYLAVVGKVFAAADTDHDGTLEPRELSTPQGRALVALLTY